jgi:hypothetical protein
MTVCNAFWKSNAQRFKRPDPSNGLHILHSEASASNALNGIRSHTWLSACSNGSPFGRAAAVLDKASRHQAIFICAIIGSRALRNISAKRWSTCRSSANAERRSLGA